MSFETERDSRVHEQGYCNGWKDGHSAGYDDAWKEVKELEAADKEAKEATMETTEIMELSDEALILRRDELREKRQQFYQMGDEILKEIDCIYNLRKRRVGNEQLISLLKSKPAQERNR